MYVPFFADLPNPPHKADEENQVYFPPSYVSIWLPFGQASLIHYRAINKDYFKSSSTHTTCPWKGEASYYDLELPDGITIKDAAWYYPKTITERAEKIKDYVAFCEFSRSVEHSGLAGDYQMADRVFAIVDKGKVNVAQ
jgi:hypothetical protein